MMEPSSEFAESATHRPDLDGEHGHASSPLRDPVPGRYGGPLSETIRHITCVARLSVIASRCRTRSDAQCTAHLKDVSRPHRAVFDRIEEAMNKAHNDDANRHRYPQSSERQRDRSTPGQVVATRHRPRVEGRTEFKDFDYGDPIDLTQFETDVHSHHPSFSLLGW